jgi:hypothetical protein
MKEYVFYQPHICDSSSKHCKYGSSNGIIGYIKETGRVIVIIKKEDDFKNLGEVYSWDGVNQ